MANELTINVDTAALMAALDRIPEAVLAHAHVACAVTANRIASAARARVGRSGIAHDHTQDFIFVVEHATKAGYRVEVNLPPEKGISLHRMKRSGRMHTQRVTQNNRPIWLEFGTVHSAAKPFLLNSARLEEGPHFRRLTDAIQDAIDEEGFGGLGTVVAA